MRPLLRLRLGLVGLALCTASIALRVPWQPFLPVLLPSRGLAASDSASDELEQNRRLLEQWRQDPAHYARLCYDLRQFLALSPEEQERLRQLDQELHEEDSATSARLGRVLERYVVWLEHLPQAERARLEAMRDPNERLLLIKEMREREWVDKLPKALRDELHPLAPEQRTARIAELREEERKRREEWLVAIRHWDELLKKSPQPARLTDFTTDVQSFVREVLTPMLNTEEKERLRQAQGRWPLFPRTLVELADKHPILLPGPTTGPTRYRDLPADVQERVPVLKNAPLWVKETEGKWPQYAMAVVELARRRKLTLPHPLGPSHPEDFSTAVQAFLSKKLLPVLEPEENNRLKRTEGQWPRYPQLILDLSRKHFLQVPNMGLPGPREFWDKFRIAVATDIEAPPDISDQTLRDFARSELTAEERANLTSFSDPAIREKLKQEYIKRHPSEWQKLLQLDNQKRQRKARNLK
jgi:hypothetical protein